MLLHKHVYVLWSTPLWVIRHHVLHELLWKSGILLEISHKILCQTFHILLWIMWTIPDLHASTNHLLVQLATIHVAHNVMLTCTRDTYMYTWYLHVWVIPTCICDTYMYAPYLHVCGLPFMRSLFLLYLVDYYWCLFSIVLLTVLMHSKLAGSLNAQQVL